MRQLTCTAPGTIGWADVPEPTLASPGDALVRPVAVARCEIDPLLVLAGPTRPAPRPPTLPEPGTVDEPMRARPSPVRDGSGPVGFALGHEAVVEVVAVGDDVSRVAVGDLVVPSFQVSCGACPSCRAGRTATCDSYPVLSDFGMQPLSGTEYGGMLSDLVRVPHADAMLTPLPTGVDPVAAASLADNVTDGYRAVAPHLRARPGAGVLVVAHGTPSIGLYAAQAALALGAGGVTVASHDDDTLDAAERIGAVAERTDYGRRTGRWPVVVDCGTRVDGLAHAVASAEPGGVVHSVSYYPDPTTPLPLGRMYTLGVTFHIGRAHSAALVPEVAALVAGGRLRPELVTSRVIGWDEAPDRYTEPAIKLVVRR